jgi:hypothetical protein
VAWLEAWLGVPQSKIVMDALNRISGIADVAIFDESSVPELPSNIRAAGRHTPYPSPNTGELRYTA